MTREEEISSMITALSEKHPDRLVIINARYGKEGCVYNLFVERVEIPWRFNLKWTELQGLVVHHLREE